MGDRYIKLRARGGSEDNKTTSLSHIGANGAGNFVEASGELYARAMQIQLAAADAAAQIADT